MYSIHIIYTQWFLFRWRKLCPRPTTVQLVLKWQTVWWWGWDVRSCASCICCVALEETMKETGREWEREREIEAKFCDVLSMWHVAERHHSNICQHSLPQLKSSAYPSNSFALLACSWINASFYLFPVLFPFTVSTATREFYMLNSSMKLRWVLAIQIIPLGYHNYNNDNKYVCILWKAFIKCCKYQYILHTLFSTLFSKETSTSFLCYIYAYLTIWASLNID